MSYVENILHCYCFPSHTWSVLIDQLLNNTKVHIVRSSFKNVNCDSQIANWFLSIVSEVPTLFKKILDMHLDIKLRKFVYRY